MSDRDLLIFGCGVLFIALGGAYVYLRERYMTVERRRPPAQRASKA